MGRSKVIVISLISVMLLAAFTAAAGAQMLCRQGGMRHHRHGMMRGVAGLQLTPEQKTKAREIFRQAKKDAAAVFTPEQRQQMTQMRRQHGRMGRLHARRGQSRQLQRLTPEQQEKIQAIRKDARAQIEAVNNEKLTRQERMTKLQAIHRSAREQMRQLIGSGQQTGRRNGPAKWQLTDDQQAQLKSIREKAHEQFRAILTPEQQQQLDGMRERMQQRMERFHKPAK
ncbi:MAG: hypothetical protein ACYDCO_03640 [Armatimonadota bacterium]